MSENMATQVGAAGIWAIYPSNVLDPEGTYNKAPRGQYPYLILLHQDGEQEGGEGMYSIEPAVAEHLVDIHPTPAPTDDLEATLERRVTVSRTGDEVMVKGRGEEKKHLIEIVVGLGRTLLETSGYTGKIGEVEERVIGKSKAAQGWLFIPVESQAVQLTIGGKEVEVLASHVVAACARLAAVELERRQLRRAAEPPSQQPDDTEV